MCLLCFLEDNYQYKLRKRAQLSTDRFEHTLEKYKLLFTEKYLKEKDELCKEHDNEFNKNFITEINELCNKEKIYNFFDSLIDIYLYWINAQPNDATATLKQLLTDTDLIEQNKTIENDVFFRGRVSKDIISHWDMFHIPFNKRYLIKNQRYSLVGQPLLYLATSPYCVIKELHNDPDLRISSFRFKEQPNLKIFNNTNFISDIAHVKNSDSVIQDINQLMEKNSLTDYASLVSFYSCILCSCCSFEVRDELKKFDFKEEYILPQLLAQVLKESGFDGIMYTSTKIFDDDIANDHFNYLKSLYTNYCIFTTYDKIKSKKVTYTYDKDLYEKFTISAPLLSNSKIDKDYYSFEECFEHVGEIINNKPDKITSYQTTLLSKILEDLANYFTYKRSNAIKEDSLLYSSLQLHCLFLHNIIFDMYNESQT